MNLLLAGLGGGYPSADPSVDERAALDAIATFRTSGNAKSGQNGGTGISAIPSATGRIGDWVLSIGGNAQGTQTVLTYQAADRFWTLQFIEAGIFVALTAAALGVAIWLLHRRPA